MAAIAFIINGKGKRKTAFYKGAKNWFKEELFDKKTFLESKYAGHMKLLTIQAIQDGFDHIIAVGGDGSINEVINGLMESVTENGQVNNEKLSQLTMGCLPFGTANDFAKSIGLRKGWPAFAELLKSKTVNPIDICRLDYRDEQGRNAMRYFLNITDIGVGGLIAKKVNRSNKWMGPDLTFFKAITGAFISYKRTLVECRNTNFQWKGKLLSLVIANASYFGSGLCIAPQAKLDDGKFTVVILGDVSLWDYFRNLPKVRAGQLIDHPQVSYHSFARLIVNGIEGSCEIDMDGEFIGYTPCKFSIHPQQLNFLASATSLK